ncbi:MAG: oligosaccharide flippase family protein, partial [bacterium]|nr:oligosaccharide flippase family protein [bacterium]
ANSIVETAVIGRLLGVRDLGFYSRANNLAALPSSAIFSVIYKVGFPAYAKIQESREKITEGFLKSWELALLTLLPFAALIFFEAGELVRILLGERWLPMAGAMKILALAMTFEGFLHLVWPVSEGTGRPDIRFKFGALQIIMSLPLLIFLSLHYGLLGAAWAMLIAFLATALSAGFWVFSYLKPGIRRVLRPAGAVMGATAVSALVGAVLKFWLAPLSLPTLIFWLFLVGLAYLLALKFFSRFWGGGPYETLRLIFKF